MTQQARRIGSGPSMAARLFSRLQRPWLRFKGILERVIGEEGIRRFFERIHWYEIKSRLIRLHADLPDGNRITYRPYDRRIIDEIYAGCYQWAIFNPSDIVVDVGANIGGFTLLAARRVGPTGRVVAVEPEPENFLLLRRNVRQNGFANVRLIQAAVDAQAGRRTLYRSGDPAMHTLLPRYADGVGVAVTTLDLVEREEDLPRVDVLKIDVEGAELRVLQGAAEILKKTRQVILEAEPPNLEAIVELLKASGFPSPEVHASQWGTLIYAARRPL